MIRIIIQAYILILILNSALSYIPSLQKEVWVKKIHQFSEFTCRYVRPYLPKDIPFDLSPLVVVVILNLIMALW